MTERTYLPDLLQLSEQEVLTARSNLVQAEQELAFYNGTEQTPLEEKAGEIIRKIKKWEEINLHGVHIDGSGWEAGHKFFHGLPSLSQSKLMAIASKAPKGCLLHCHFDAMLPPQVILSGARRQDNLFIKSDVPLLSEGLFAHALPQFTKFAQASTPVPNETTNLFSKSYLAGSYMRYSTFLESFPGGVGRGEDWVRQKMFLGADVAYTAQQTVDGIWRHFQRSVIVTRSLLCYETAYREHIRSLLWVLAEDGVQYAEIRVALNYKFAISSDNGEKYLGVSEILQLFVDVMSEELPRIRKQGIDFFGIKIIYGCMRNSTKEAMVWCMDKCIEMKQQFPELICGFDMQGQEDAGFPLRYWLPELLAMRKKCSELKLDLPFIFHAGETLDHGGDTDSNLYDAILLGTKRIGHGFSLTKHPLLMQICKEKGILIETCPISNEILGLCGNAKGHHLATLLSHGVPASISSDDPGSWQAMILSHDFYTAMVGSNQMSLLGWRILGEWSIQYSCLDENAKGQLLKSFGTKWQEFCQWIVDTEGGQSYQSAETL